MEAKARAEIARQVNIYPGGQQQCQIDCNKQGAAFDALVPGAKKAIERIFELGAVQTEMAEKRDNMQDIEVIAKEIETLKEKERTALKALDDFAKDRAEKKKALSSAEYKKWKDQYKAILVSLA